MVLYSVPCFTHHMASLSLLTTLQFLHHRFPHTSRPTLPSTFRRNSYPRPRRSWTLRGGRFVNCRLLCKAKTTGVEEESMGDEESERPPFDINLAVVLAGFAFESYTGPPENDGRKEVDAAGCKTVYLSESFVREIYDGQLFVKLKKGQKLPALDPWGTSDPYVVMELDGQVAKSKVKWGTKEPTWNEEFILNIRLYPTKSLQVAAWDANLVTPHKRMGNTCINLEDLCDGSLHEVLVELEGMGGGGELHLEVKYRSFDEIDGEKVWWRIPFVEEFLQKNGFDSAVKMLVGSESVPARQFVEYAFGQLKSFNDANLWKERVLTKKNDVQDIEKPIKSELESEMSSQFDVNAGSSVYSSSNDIKSEVEIANGDEMSNKPLSDPATFDNKSIKSEKHFWQNLSGIINGDVAQKLGFQFPENLKRDGFDLLSKIGLQLRDTAEAVYIESGLAVPDVHDINNNEAASSIKAIKQSLPDIKKATRDVIRQTESVLGTLMVLTAAVSQLNKEVSDAKKQDKEDISQNGNYDDSSSIVELQSSTENGTGLDSEKAEEMKTLFSTAESAIEAWALLASSLGHPSFIKSEFEKLCFLDNSSTDTQVAIWRDSMRKRLVVAFRGTEQVKWKDLRTDLMLLPAGLNPERIGGDFKQEVQVHSGFLTAYDSVRIRIISLIKLSIGYVDDCTQLPHKWQIYVTGHSLGGALATLLALELSSQMAKHGAISVTMYNFGSPRVGNKRFADVYNEKVKDSWRIVNHRDIIPTVPRLMGYCHVAHPVYLAAGGLTGSKVNMELLGDGYEGDVIGESTPDALVTEFMKGEKELIERILQTEINIFRSIRDGTALMQHMEDFYYISLLESVRSNYQTTSASQSSIQGDIGNA